MKLQINAVGRLAEVIVDDGEPKIFDLRTFHFDKSGDDGFVTNLYPLEPLGFDEITIDGEAPSDWDDMKTKLAAVFPKANSGDGGSGEIPTLADVLDVNNNAEGNFIYGIANAIDDDGNEDALTTTMNLISVGRKVNAMLLDEPILNSARIKGNNELGSEEVDVNTNPNWVVNAGVADPDDNTKWNSDGSNQIDIAFPDTDSAMIVGEFYEVNFNVFGAGAAAINVSIGNSEIKTAQFGATVVKIVLQYITGDNKIHITATSLFSGSILSISLKKINTLGSSAIAENPIKYSNGVADQILQSGDVSLIPNMGIVGVFRKLIASISHDGVGAPAMGRIFQNTLKSTNLGWSAGDPGIYFLTDLDNNDSFSNMPDKSYVLFNSGAVVGYALLTSTNDNILTLKTVGTDGSTLTDLTFQLTFEILVGIES